MTLPPPGWYPDPASADNIRFWDGQSWTDRVQPKTLPPPPLGSQPLTPPAPAERGPASQNDPRYDMYGGYRPAAPISTTAPGQRLGPDGQVLAGWWRRFGGYIIDRLVEYLPALLAGIIAVSVITGRGGVVIDQQALQNFFDEINAGGNPDPVQLLDAVGPGLWTVLVVSGVVWLVISVLNGIVLIARSGQTLGDRVVGVRKVMQGRTVPTGAVATGRWLIPNLLFQLVSNLVPVGFLVSFIDYLWPLWDGRNQTLHDKIVRTYVERADLAGPPVPRG